MSESGEENEDTLNDQNSADDDDEFSFYLQFTKPLVLDLTEPEDRAMAAAWVRKLEGGSNAPEEKQLRVNYLKLLLFVLQRGRLGGIFRKQPPSGSLQSFPAGFNVFDMANLILDQDDLQPSGAGDGHAVNYNTEISNDLREFVASQEIPNFGIQMYYAWSADEPIHKWALYDEDKFPQYILEKIKLIKETQSDEKSGSLTKSRGQTKKKVCDLSVLEKCPKKKVKSPQEIERSQGRSFHTYMGLVGRMGNFEKCDGDLERHPRPQPPQARGTCSRRINQNQNQCPGQDQRRFTSQECEDDPGEDNFHNFMPGLSDLVNAQSRPCLCPYPCHHADCPEHRGARGGGGSHHEPIARASVTNASTKQFCAPDWGASGSQTVTKASVPTRFNEIDPSNPRMSSIGPPHGSQGAHCSHKRSASSPTSKSNCPSRTNFEPPPQDFYGKQNFSQAPGVSNNFCRCPCPREPMIGQSASTTGIMGGMGVMAGMGGMPNMGYMGGMGGMGCMGGIGGMPGIPGMPGMAGMGGMPGMPGMAGMGGMPGMPGMAGMGGVPNMPSMAGMGGMPGMPGMGGMGFMASMGNMGGGRTCTSGRPITQDKSRPNARGRNNESSQLAASFRTPPNAYCSGVEGTPSQAGMPTTIRPGVNNARSRQNVFHCYDNQQVDASFTHTIQKNAPECSGTYTRRLPLEEDNTMHHQTCMEDGSPDELTKKNERISLVTAARENKVKLAAKKSLFDAGPQKSQSAQFHTINAATVTKRQLTPAVCPTMEEKSPDYTTSGSEKMLMQSERSSSMEPLSQSHSPRPQAPCPTPQHFCSPKITKLQNHGFQNQSSYGQERQVCPSGATKTLSPLRPGTARTVNLSKNQTAGGRGTFVVNDETARFCNMPNLLQNMRQIVDNYRGGAEEQCSSGPEACPIDQKESQSGIDFEFTRYLEPPPPKPNVYYSPQPRRRNIVVSPCMERDVASLPDRTAGMGIFNPQKMPTQAQPLPNTPPDSAYIDYWKYEGDEESFLYGTEESSYDPPRGPFCPTEEQQPLRISSMHMPNSSHQARERSPATAERVRDCSRREHSADARQCLHETKIHTLSPPKHDMPQKSNRRDNFACSTPVKSYTTLPPTMSSIHQSYAPETYHRSPKITLTDCDEPSRTEFVQIFGGSRQDETSQQKDSVHFETLECSTRQGSWYS